MKTIITAAWLAVLSAVLFAWMMMRDAPAPVVVAVAPMLGNSERDPVVESVEEVVEKIDVEDSQPAELPIGEEAPAVVAKDEALVEGGAIVYSDFVGPLAPVLPFVMNINASEEAVSMQGSVPNRALKVAVYDAMAGVVQDKAIDDRLKLSHETKGGVWLDALPSFIERFFQHTGGAQELSIVDGSLALQASVATDECKAVLLSWTQPFVDHGLAVVDQVDIDEALIGKLEPISQGESMGSDEGDDDAKGVESDVEMAETEANDGEMKVTYLGPDGERMDGMIAKVDEVPVSEVIDVGADTPETELPARVAPKWDDGKPLIFYFDSPSGDIVEGDRVKIDFAIKRAKGRKAIIYVTGYSDYRGEFAKNQELALYRAERVKELIFAGKVGDQVKAEVKVQGDTLAQKIAGSESKAQLQRSRRVVVEVYYLK